MHGFVELLIVTTATVLMALTALTIGYFAYASRRAKERLALRELRTGPDANELLAEYRLLADETKACWLRAGATARSMRDGVEQGVR